VSVASVIGILGTYQYSLEIEDGLMSLFGFLKDFTFFIFDYKYFDSITLYNNIIPIKYQNVNFE